MTLRELIAANRSMFYEQSWFANEPFADLDVPIDGMEMSAPAGFVALPWAREFGEHHAVVLAACYVQHPHDEVWGRYLWTSDRDSEGQVVFVGSNGKGLEIHRNLAITDRWGHASWE